MARECSVAAVIGFPIRKDQIVDTAEIPSCEHVKPASAIFCPDCGVRIGMQSVEVEKISRRRVVFARIAGWKFGDCSLMFRGSFDGHDPSDDERYLLGIKIGEAIVVPDPTPVDISIAKYNFALNRVLADRQLFPDSPPPSLHLLPYASY